MPRSRAGIALIQRPVNQSVKKHRRGAREHHTDDNQNKNSQRRPAVRGNNERAQRKRKRKNCVRKTNQSQKTRHRSTNSNLLPWLMHAKDFLPKTAKKTKIVLLVVAHETPKIDENQEGAEQLPLKLKLLRMFSAQFFPLVRASLPD